MSVSSVRCRTGKRNTLSCSARRTACSKDSLLLSPHVILGANPIRKGDTILSRQYTEAGDAPPCTGGENEMSLNVYISPDLDDEEDVQERNEDDDEGEFCYRFSVRTRILLSLWLRRLAQKIIVLG